MMGDSAGVQFMQEAGEAIFMSTAVEWSAQSDETYSSAILPALLVHRNGHGLLKLMLETTRVED